MPPDIDPNTELKTGSDRTRQWRLQWGALTNTLSFDERNRILADHVNASAAFVRFDCDCKGEYHGATTRHKHAIRRGFAHTETYGEVHDIAAEMFEEMTDFMSQGEWE